MAEFVMKFLAEKSGRKNEFLIDSKATSSEEIGNPPHQGTVQKLREMNVPVYFHRAQKMTVRDYEFYDMIIAMDEENLRGIKRICGNDVQKKVSLLLEHCGRSGEIADPWYTGNFDETFCDVMEGCRGLLAELTNGS